MIRKHNFNAIFTPDKLVDELDADPEDVVAIMVERDMQPVMTAGENEYYDVGQLEEIRAALNRPTIRAVPPGFNFER